MIKKRKSKRIKAVVQSRKASVSTFGNAKTRAGNNQTPVPTTRDTSKPIGLDPRAKIKKEKTAKPENIARECLGLGDNVFRYQCSVCNLRTASLRSVLNHRQLVHHITPKPMKNVDLEPDTDDPNYYCKSCENHSNGWPAYRYHLHKNHHLSLKNLRRKRGRPYNTTPDSNELDYRCTLCKLTYRDEQAYQQHLKEHHKTKPSAANTRSNLDLDCVPCNLTYASKASYNRPCRHIHTMKPLKGPKSTPAHSTNNYCKICQQGYSLKQTYERHLFLVHQIDYKAAQAQEEGKSDISKPNLYCRSCDKTLSSKNSFTSHLFLIHSIRQPEKNKGRLQPDANDPNHYCRVCQRHYSRNAVYRQHLRQVHQMTLQRSEYFENRRHYKDAQRTVLVDRKSSNPVAATGINRPTHYCVQCERSFRNKSVFTSHMKNNHGILA